MPDFILSGCPVGKLILKLAGYPANLMTFIDKMSPQNCAFPVSANALLNVLKRKLR
jgi:hypothetical protein